MATDAACLPQKFDLKTSTCVDALAGLFQAYLALVAGQQRIEVRYGERWVTYRHSSATELRDLYVTLYNQCPDAKTSGLPDLNPANKVKRGAPARGFQSWPHM